MSKNKQYKEYRSNGGTLSFAEWMRKSLDTEVKQTVAQYKNASGGCDAATTYKPDITHNTVLGVNKWLVYGVAAIALGAIAYGVYNKHKNKK